MTINQLADYIIEISGKNITKKHGSSKIGYRIQGQDTGYRGEDSWFIVLCPWFLVEEVMTYKYRKV